MAYIVEIDARSKAAKKFLEYVKTLSFAKVKEESPYNPEFVKMIKKSAASKKRYEVNPDDVWGSLGLK